jgi:hypothetical protein
MGDKKQPRLLAVCLIIVVVSALCIPGAASARERPLRGRKAGEHIRQPFLRNITFKNISIYQSSVSESFWIPQGKRLVIELVTLYGYSQISISYTPGSGGPVQEAGGPRLVHLFINSTVGQYSGTDAVLAASNASGPKGLNYWNLVQPLKIYADPEKPVNIKIQGLPRFGVDAHFLVTVSGYLVDVVD